MGHPLLTTLGGASFNPLAMSTPPNAWYFAENLATVSNGTTAPTALNDPVGRAFNLAGTATVPDCIQATAGSRPVYDPTGINSRPAIKWPATRFLTTGVLGAPLSQPNTTFVVFRNADLTTQVNIFDGAATGGRNLLWINGTGKQVGAYAGGAQYDPARADPGVYLYCVQYNTTSSFIRRNGSVVKSGVDVSSQAAGGYTLGTDNAGTGSPFNGWVREFISFNAALTTAQIEQVENFLAARSGISIYRQATSGTIGGLAWQFIPANVPSQRGLMFHHGRSQSPAPTAFLADAQLVPLYQLALSKGWHVFYTNNTTQTGWGKPSDQNEHVALWQLLAARETFQRLAFWGQSMGGITAQALIADSRFMNVSGFFGTYPACDVKAVHDSPGTFAAEIEADYGTNAAGLEAASAPYNPMRLPAANFTGKRWVVTHSASDTVVEKAANSTAMKAKILATATSPTILDTTGEHGDNSNFDATVQAAFGTFLDNCAA